MKKAFLIILLLILANQAEAQDKDPAIKIGEKFRLHSKVLNEDRPYWVYLPESYNSKSQSPEAYPVLYLLRENETASRGVRLEFVDIHIFAV
jgi:hypothetical protein